MGNCPLLSLDLSQCLLEGPQVFAISGCCSLVVVDGLPSVGFVVVLCFCQIVHIELFINEMG